MKRKEKLQEIRKIITVRNKMKRKHTRKIQTHTHTKFKKNDKNDKKK